VERRCDDILRATKSGARQRTVDRRKRPRARTATPKNAQALSAQRKPQNTVLEGIEEPRGAIGGGGNGGKKAKSRVALEPKTVLGRSRTRRGPKETAITERKGKKKGTRKAYDS